MNNDRPFYRASDRMENREKFRDIFSYISMKTYMYVYCGSSLEPSGQNGSTEGSHICFYRKIKIIIYKSYL